MLRLSLILPRKPVTDKIYELLLEAARDLSAGLSEDIEKSRTREEHIRVVSRANSAAALYNLLITYSDESNDQLAALDNPDK